jgi:hypothetical protein
MRSGEAAVYDPYREGVCHQLHTYLERKHQSNNNAIAEENIFRAITYRMVRKQTDRVIKREH